LSLHNGNTQLKATTILTTYDSKFDRIEVSASFDIILEKCDHHKVKIIDDSNMILEVFAEIKNNKIIKVKVIGSWILYTSQLKSLKFLLNGWIMSSKCLPD
tara:strand:- start:143 stop:445 length:303 start_codon:yes stop_codon:yes gene_type:complete